MADLNELELPSLSGVLPPDPDTAKWEMLIDQIVEGNVIPVIGSSILSNNNLEQYLIDGLAKQCGITSRPTNFSELVYDPAFGNREIIYSWLNKVWEKQLSHNVVPSPLLKRILSIRQFPFVITTSFFPIVEQAMQEVWGERTVKVMCFSNNPATTMLGGVGDIKNANDISAPTVYYMFGKVCNSAHRFVVTDTDMLAFCSSWLSTERRPPVLSSVLKDKYLLVLGAGYPDWLFRFIWYSMNLTENTRDPFSKTQGMMVDDKAEDSLIRFLNRLDTFTQKDPLFVINTIEEKLAERKENPQIEKPRKGCDVFISYSRNDSALAEMLYHTLSSKGLSVWYDRGPDGLAVGADWIGEIEQAIRTSRVFVPLLTSTLEKEKNDYHMYLKEWSIANRRAEGFRREFILPIAAEGVDMYDDFFPRAFRVANAGFFNERQPDFTAFAEAVLAIINKL